MATEMLDVTDAHGAAFELDHVEQASLEETTAEWIIRDAFGVVDDAVVEIRVHLRVRLEHEFTGEGVLAGLVQRHPDRL